MKNLFIFICTIFFFTLCQQATDLAGIWRGQIDLGERTLPFSFEIKLNSHDTVVYLINAEEKLVIEDAQFGKDSFMVPLHIFDAYLSGVITDNSLEGIYNRQYKENYILPFRAEKGGSRYATSASTAAIADRYRVRFTEKDGSTYEAIGLFEGKESLTGTFLTETGDYRYLEGVLRNDSLFLSSFDGEHLFLFEAAINEDTIKGGFWSGSHYYADWIAYPDQNFELTSADSLTLLTDENHPFDFSFPNLEGETVRLSDFAGKPVIVQLLGTWCPNCMDETVFLGDWLQDSKTEIVVVGLAYEQKDSFEYAAKRVAKMKSKLDVPYQILIAGSADKSAASKTLPMLNKIISFPTTIFLNREHEVIKIYTGFSGPGTGKYYEAFKKDFEETVERMK
jgi:thiol-disulfide isomerase/thioredoxin